MKLNVGDHDGSGPGRASVAGEKGGHSVRLNGNNHSSAGLHERLSSDALREIGSGDGRAPGETSVAGAAHHDLTVVQGVVPLQITVSVVGTGWPTVTDDPVFVGTWRGGISADRILPSHPVAGTTHYHSGSLESAGKRERGDHPDCVLGVIGDCRIAGRVVGSSSLSGGQTGQEAVSPSRSAVAGRSPADVGRSARSDASALECRDQGGAVGQHVWLNFSGVLPGSNGVRVGTDLGEIRSDRILGSGWSGRRGGGGR